MTSYCYMCRSWQDCCRRGENRSWPSVSVESVDNECCCMNNPIFYAFIMRLTVEECVFILESYSKTMSYVHCRQSSFEKFRRQAPVKSCIAKMIKKFHRRINERTLRKAARNMVKLVDTCIEKNGHHFQHLL
jgi:hypothetical protein